MSSLLHFDLVSLDRLLSNDLPLEIVHHRQRDSFVLMVMQAEIVEFAL